MSLLEVSGLRVHFPGRPQPAVDGLTFSLESGETLGLAGESGSGKSVTALALMGLLPARASVHGALRFKGQDLVTMPPASLRRLRGRELAMVFQDPMTALNPYLRVGTQMAEILRLHQGLGAAAADAECRRFLEAVQMPEAARRLRQYPHELSGGQCQRVMIAMALLCRPSLLIADEPTTALDVTVQAQVLRLLGELRREFQLAVLLISHDLGVIAECCERVLVLRSGRCVETGPADQVLQRPAEPYTQALVAARPRLEGPAAADVLAKSPNELLSC